MKACFQHASKVSYQCRPLREALALMPMKHQCIRLVFGVHRGKPFIGPQDQRNRAWEHVRSPAHSVSGCHMDVHAALVLDAGHTSETESRYMSSVYIGGPLTGKMAPNGRKRPPMTDLRGPNGPPMRWAREPTGPPMPKLGAHRPQCVGKGGPPQRLKSGYICICAYVYVYLPV
jgi:hypothetical protein